MKASSLAAVPFALAAIGLGPAAEAVRPVDPPALSAFLSAGLGTQHERAPAQTRQFGRLVGVWDVEMEIRRRDGSWDGAWPGVWAWKYSIDGFAVQDLFCQSADRLPPYLGPLGRDYLLTAIRIYDARAGRWNVAWMANGAGATPGGAGATPGADFGTFEATQDGERLVMTSREPSSMGDQRIVFSGFAEGSFLWESEFSSDGGQTWQTVMRVRARRRDAP
jgi:hypothetical protein